MSRHRGGNGSRPTSTGRRSKAEIAVIKDAIEDILLEETDPITVRHLFYRLVSLGLVEKTEAEYKRTVVRLATRMRLDGEIGFDAFADNTRWQRRPVMHSSLSRMMEDSSRLYRRDLWAEQGQYVEIWLEKDAVADLIWREIEEWGVPLMVCRGYASLSFLHAAAKAIEEQDKPAQIYYLGDHDPSGVDIPRAVEARLREFAPDAAPITFTRLAVTEEQIAEWNLPTRPTKSSDSRAAGFEGGSVEVDAVPPRLLRQLVGNAIEGHTDPFALARTREVEQAERDTLAQIAKHLPGGGGPPPDPTAAAWNSMFGRTFG
ncbi:MAG: hypothetical protein HYY06_01495 [Deltaproteobacteria bacterium]|nr:hypothetical protein [Deltaproteobacteria bacterium]